MNRTIRAFILALTVVFLGACSSTEYIMSTTDGTMITTRGKPSLDSKTGMYTYEDVQGKKGTISKDNVKQIMER